LGTQVKGHNERRFGVKWEKPVDKMREVILAVRAFWDCWQNQTRLNFQGEFFKLTLMTPFFSPAPHEYHRIPIFIAGVNRRMCQLGGELCEGFHVHPLHTARYLKEVVLPNIDQGLTITKRERQAIELSSSIFVIPTDDPKEAAKYEAEVRQQISFYASTPPYRPVFELEGWGDVADQLKTLVARGRWSDMPLLITDEMLDQFVLRGRWAELPEKVLRKYDGLLDRVSYYFPIVPGENEKGWRSTVAGFKRQ
jgi:probable F420-dependent oxidoreductase